MKSPRKWCQIINFRQGDLDGIEMVTEIGPRISSMAQASQCCQFLPSQAEEQSSAIYVPNNVRRHPVSSILKNKKMLVSNTFES